MPPNAGQRNRHRGKDGGAKRGDKRMQSPPAPGARAGSGLVATSSSPAPQIAGEGHGGRLGEEGSGRRARVPERAAGLWAAPRPLLPVPVPPIGSSLQKGLSGEGKGTVG